MTVVQRNLNIYFYKLLMYVGMPMGIEGMKWLPEGNDCRIRIRLAKPYDAGYGNHIKTGGGLPNAYGAGYGLQTYDPDLDINNYNPKFAFSTVGILSKTILKRLRKTSTSSLWCPILTMLTTPTKAMP